MVFPKFRKYCVLSGIWFMIPSYALLAQSTFSLHALIEAGNNHLPLLQQKRALIGAAQASLSDIKHSFLPQIRASEQLNIASDNSLAGSFFTMGITPSTSAGVLENNTFQAATGNMAVIYGEYELATFGLRGAKVTQGLGGVRLQEADLQQQTYLLQREIVRLYLTILRDQHRLLADSQNVVRYQSIFTIIQSLTASGINAGADSSLAKAELSRTRMSFNQTKGRINGLKQQLAYLTGLSANSLQLDTLNGFSINTIPSSPISEIASVEHPLLAYYQRRNELIKAEQQVIRKSYLPKIMLLTSVWARGSSIQFSDQYKSLDRGLGFQRFNYGAGVALTYNLFNSIYRKDRLMINRFQLQASDFELQQQRLELQSAVLQANNSIETVRSNLSELPVQLEAAQVAYQQKVAQYKAGISSLIDLTNASFVLYRSQTDYIEALSDWYLAQLDKAVATGSLPVFIQTLK